MAPLGRGAAQAPAAAPPQLRPQMMAPPPGMMQGNNITVNSDNFKKINNNWPFTGLPPGMPAGMGRGSLPIRPPTMPMRGAPPPGRGGF